MTTNSDMWFGVLIGLSLSVLTLITLVIVLLRLTSGFANRLMARDLRDYQRNTGSTGAADGVPVKQQSDEPESPSPGYMALKHDQEDMADLAGTVERGLAGYMGAPIRMEDLDA